MLCDSGIWNCSYQRKFLSRSSNISKDGWLQSESLLFLCGHLYGLLIVQHSCHLYVYNPWITVLVCQHNKVRESKCDLKIYCKRRTYFHIFQILNKWIFHCSVVLSRFSENCKTLQRGHCTVLLHYRKFNYESGLKCLEEVVAGITFIFLLTI